MDYICTKLSSVSLLHHLLNGGGVFVEDTILFFNAVESWAPTRNVPCFQSLLRIVCKICQQVCEVRILPWSLVGGRKLWVGLSLYEHCGPCRRQFTAVFVDNPSSRKLMKWSCSRPSLWDPSLVAPLVLLVWPKSLGHRTAMDLATIHCSFHHFRDLYNIEGWQALDAESILVELLHHLWAPWSFCMFSYCHFLRCFKCLLYNSLRWHGRIWLMRFTVWNKASTVMVDYLVWGGCFVAIIRDSIMMSGHSTCVHMYTGRCRTHMDAPYLNAG